MTRSDASTTPTVPTAATIASHARAAAGPTTIGDYLIRRLQDYGIGHVFGIPGDYVLAFYNMLEQSPLEVIGCTREDNAGFAADAYARVHGMGAACVTYCVGGFSISNSIAGAYAEKSPVVMITGSPGLNERTNNPLLHHRVRDFRTQLEVFEKICVAGTELNDPLIAFREIDRVLEACARYKRPVYIEIPRDMVRVAPPVSPASERTELTSDAEALAEAADEAARIIGGSQRPIIIAGVEIHRFGLQDKVLALAEGAQIPIAATMLGKSAIRETHPLYIGLYEGAIGREIITEYVEESDCIILLGTFMSDINLGIYTAKLDPGRCIYATSEQLRIRHHHYHDVLLGDFLRELNGRRPTPPKRALPEREEPAPFVAEANAPITIERMVARLNQSLDNETIVIADVGDALFGATELVTHERTEFLSPAYYTSMGFAVPATLGANVARPDLRAITLVGDGAFQMTGMELSTIIRHGFAPVVIVLDNKGYGTERFLHPGPFNDIQPWNYHQLTQVLGGGTGYEVRSEQEFDDALTQALADRSALSLIQVHISEEDRSQALDRLASRLGQRV